MNTMTQGLDARKYLTGWLSGLVNMYTADINAIPEDKWTAGFGGCTRNAAELTADTIAMMNWVTNAIGGEIGQLGEEQTAQLAKTHTETREKAAAALAMAADEFSAAVNGASDETLNSAVMAPWGMEAPLFSLAHIAVSHVWYHDGQLNYKQCLLGDEKVHWMD